MILVVGPLAFICLASDVGKLSESVSVTQIPATFIRCAVSEEHDTVAVSEAS